MTWQEAAAKTFEHPAPSDTRIAGHKSLDMINLQRILHKKWLETYEHRAS